MVAVGRYINSSFLIILSLVLVTSKKVIQLRFLLRTASWSRFLTSWPETAHRPLLQQIFRSFVVEVGVEEVRVRLFVLVDAFDGFDGWFWFFFVVLAVVLDDVVDGDPKLFYYLVLALLKNFNLLFEVNDFLLANFDFQPERHEFLGEVALGLMQFVLEE